MLLLNELDRDEVINFLSQLIMPVHQSEKILKIINHLKNLEKQQDIKEENKNV